MRTCDNTLITWRPDWVDVECGECGHVTGKHDTAEPDFHRKREWRGIDLVCTRCGAIMADLEKINQIAVEKLLPKLEESIMHESALLAHMKQGFR